MAAAPIVLPSPKRSLGLPALGLAFSLLATLGVAAYVAAVASAKDEVRFESRARAIVATVETRMESYLALLQAAERLLALGRGVGGEELRQFIEGLELAERYPGIVAMGFATRVPGVDDGQVAVAGWSSGAGEELATARRFLAAGDGAAAATRAAAMARARDSGNPSATGRITVGEAAGAGGEPGFLVYLPLYRPAAPAPTVEARRAALAGFVFATFRGDELLHGDLGSGAGSGLSLQIFSGDRQDPDALLYRSPDLDPRPTLADTRSIQVAGAPWTVVVATRPSFFTASSRGQAFLVVLLGAAFSALLFLALRSQAGARAAAESIAADLRRSQEELRRTSEQYRRLVEVSPEATFLVRDGRFAFVNPACVEVLRARAPSRLLDRPVLDFVHPDDRTAVEGHLRAMETEGTSVSLAEHRWVRGDGAVVYVEMAGVGTAFEGAPAAQVVLRDVSDRKRQEEELHRILYRQRRDRDELETMHRIGRILSAELDVARLRGALAEEAAAVLGARHRAFVPADEDGTELEAAGGDGEAVPLARLRPLVERTLASSRPVAIRDLRAEESVVADPSNEVRSFLGAPVVSRSGEVLGALVFGHPQTDVFGPRERRILEGIAAQGAVALDNANLYRQAAEARALAETANRSKDEFLATLSHELRTPLAAIVNWAQVLRRSGEDEEKLSQGLDTILRNARVQAQLMDDLLDVSRIVSGKMRLHVAAVDLPEVIDAALDSIRPAAEARGIRLVSRYDPRAGAVRGDADRLQQVVWNLLSNAVKFTPSGGRVEAWLRRVGDTVEIVVADTGIGIREEFLPQVFDRFRQFDSSTKRQRGGLGLGLSIVRHLSELHGGSARVESEGEGRGCTFVVSLPLAESRLVGIAADETGPVAVREPDGEASGDAREVLRGTSVLVVDDEPDAREALRQVLELAQAEVFAAGSAQEALELLQRHRPDVLLSDIAMPGEDGYTLIRKVRALPPELGGETPAAALTAFAYPDDRARALDAGFQLHIPKPVDVDQLGRAVLRLARGETGVRSGA